MKIGKIDGRWFLGGSHLFLLVVCFVVYDLQRTPVQIVSGYLTALVVERFFYAFSKKNSHRSLGDSLFSAATEAAGLLILVRSSYEYAYVIFSAVAVASKYLLRLDDRRHMFNPTNVAIVVGLTLVPRHYFEVRPDDFNQNFYPIFHVFMFGLFAVYFGKTWMVTISYFLSICLISAGLALLSSESIVYFLGPEVGAIGFIFMFLMITDPRTTPVSRQGQILYGCSVAAILYVLRHFEMFYAHFFALFIVTLARGIFETFRQSRIMPLNR